MNFAQSRHQAGMEKLIEEAEVAAEARGALDEVTDRRKRTDRIAQFRTATSSSLSDASRVDSTGGARQ